MQLDDWFEHARRDAVRRGLPDLEPLLDMLLQATRALRAADWTRTGALGTAGDDPGAGDDAAPGIHEAPRNRQAAGMDADGAAAGDDAAPGNHQAAGNRQPTGLDADASSDPTGARRKTPGNRR